MSPEKVEVLKFGGTSVGNADAFHQSCSVIEGHIEKGKGLVVVVSAMAGVTNQLHEAWDLALNRDSCRPQKLIDEIKQQHMEVLHQLVRGSDVEQLEGKIAKVTDEVQTVLGAVSTLQTGSLMTKDRVISVGERMSPYLMVAALQSMGRSAVVLDAAQVMKTDSLFGDATPEYKPTIKRAKELISPELENGNVVVIGGYYGTDVSGKIATFGRGGSDLTATALGRVLQSLEYRVLGINFYKADVGGVMTADPKIVQAARLIPHLTRDEAAALSMLGGSVLHPRAVHALPETIPIYCRGTLDPDDPGTVIDNNILQDDPPIKAVTALPLLRLISVRGPGMDQPGIAASILGDLGGRKINVRAMSQFPTERVIHIVIPPDADTDAVIGGLKRTFAEQIVREDMETIKSEDVSAVGIVGDGVNRPEVLIDVFGALRQKAEIFNGGNGASRKNGPIFIGPGDHQYTIFIREEDGKKAKAVVQALHHVLFEDK